MSCLQANAPSFEEDAQCCPAALAQQAAVVVLEVIMKKKNLRGDETTSIN